EPELLCLDEPTAGMSAAETHDTMALVRRIAKDLTILIVEHDMQVVMALAQRISVFHYGDLLAEGTPAEIQQNPRVPEGYLKPGPVMPRPCSLSSRSRTCTPTTARATSCTASRSTSTAARSWACSGATASARARRSRPSWAWCIPIAARCCSPASQSPVCRRT